MQRVVIYLKRRADLARPVFFDWWLHHHGALAAQLPGLHRYIIALAADEQEGPFDGMAELWFDDLAAAESASRSQRLFRRQRCTACSSSQDASHSASVGFHTVAAWNPHCCLGLLVRHQPQQAVPAELPEPRCPPAGPVQRAPPPTVALQLPRPLNRHALADMEAPCGGRASTPAMPWAPRTEWGAMRGSRCAPARAAPAGALPAALWHKSV